ncbi:MAG: hypothetical protein IKO72_02210 [Kiritimatiellae bacterium]|nr:hypothetical protein [Kiritimatiellia bacterium]
MNNTTSNGMINVPIEARSIFRVLAIRKVVENPSLVAELSERIEEIIKAIPPASRFDRIKNGKDFLAYRTRHEGSAELKDKITNMREEDLCRSTSAFFGECGGLGTVFDYQIPLAESRDKGDGVIDMLSLSTDRKTIYVIEAKKWNSTEHPLRAIFEAITFWRMITDHNENESDKFAKSGEGFIETYNQSRLKMKTRSKSPIRLPENIPNGKIPSGADFIPAILISKNRKVGTTYNKLTQASDLYKSLYHTIHTLTKLKCFTYGVNGSDENGIEIEDETNLLSP